MTSPNDAQQYIGRTAVDFDGDNVRLAVSKDTIKDAPNVDDDEHVSGDEQDALYDYYGDTVASRGAGLQETGRPGLPDPAGYASGETTAGDAMTRSEERLNVGK